MTTMNKDFEAIVMNSYAELCIMWRVAHVTNQSQADDFDAKLKSLEAVVAAFDLNTPDMEEIPEATAPPAQPRAQNSEPAHQPAVGMMLED
jgi:hypothetical protein